MTEPPRDELVIKVLAALRVPGVSVHDVIQVHRRYLVELMQQWTRLKEDEADFDLTFALVVDAELFRLDSVVRWLDTADGRLKRAASEPSVASTRPGHPAEAGRAAMSFLELRHVSKSYGEGATEVHAIRDVDLAVERGSLVAVMGPSGSGKSTLLTIAGSLEEPTSGEVVIDGASLQAMSRNDKARLRRRTIGYVFQDFNLLAGLTAVENVALPLELDGLRRRRRTWREWLRSKSSGSPIGRRTIPTSSPAVSASGSPSLAPWSASVTSSSPTSRRVRSTRRTARP